MKKQITTIAIAALLIGFTSCKSSNDTTSTNTREAQTERGGQSRERGGQNERRERPNAEQMFTEMDANKDGKLSKDEVKGPLQEQFSKIDTDEDNFISKEELENAPKPVRGGGQGGRPQGGRN